MAEPILPAIRIARGVVDRRFVNTRRQCGDIGQAVEDGPMVQFRDRRRDKNLEMRDVGNEEIGNPPARPFQVLGVLGKTTGTSALLMAGAPGSECQSDSNCSIDAGVKRVAAQPLAAAHINLGALHYVSHCRISFQRRADRFRRAL